jgi:hypothetical protein
MSESQADRKSREQQLVDKAALGETLECSQLSIEQLLATDDPKHTINAEWLRKLLLKGYDKPPDRRGILLHRARIIGRLDLSRIEAAVGMELQGCHFDHPVLLENARLPWLTLTDSCVPALHGDELQIDGDLRLDGNFRVTGRSVDGVVQLSQAHITGSLGMTGAVLTNETGPALSADQLQVGGNLFLNGGFRATGHGDLGAVRLLGTHIMGRMDMSGAVLTNETGPALFADQLRVDQGLSLGQGFRASGHGDDGAVRLPGAEITGYLLMSGAVLTNAAGPALRGGGIKVIGDLYLNKGFRATGHGGGGAVELTGAHIIGQMDMSGAVLTNETGPALAGDWLQVDGSLNLEDFRATGHGGNGAVRLPAAHITGQLILRDAILINKSGSALIGDQLHVDLDLLLDRFRAIGHGDNGAVELQSSHIKSRLSLRNAAWAQTVVATGNYSSRF